MTTTAPRRIGLGTPRAHEVRSAFPWPLVALLIAGGVAEFALLALWQRNGYWDFSDGVYAQSARELIHGLAPYRDFAAAQPPPVYLVGALLLLIHDGLASLRAGLALVQLASAVLVSVSVWRLTRGRWVAVGAAAIAPLLPISLHEHAQLIPETLSAPLLLAGALGCARPRHAAVGGVLLALAVSCKLAFVVPAVAIVAVSPARRQATLSLLLAGAALAGSSLAVFGTGVWRQAVVAQLDVGRASLHYAGGLLAQGAWSELALVIPAAGALSVAARAPQTVDDHDLVRTIGAGAATALLLALTVFKRGSYINVLVVAEPLLLVLAAAGAAWLWRLRTGWAAVSVVLGALLAAQSISLLVSPSRPSMSKRPGARTGLEWSAGPAAVDQAVSVARRCPAGLAYSRDPYFAFLAKRRMPGGQPDLFMLRYAGADRVFARRAAADQPRCP
jgi:hypothetical protein